MTYEQMFERLLALAKECVEQDRKILELRHENEVLKNIVNYLVDNRKVDEHV